ncbi:hypothetical protein B0H16DRAFT_1572137 [Mycena metata]|uniref:Uncharacterized protein n=1 Tax=Mycena metata TaxID=1033252 RepID=A0AAD7MY93_9AGAR|nr:hypothetical protein B0H16DRAFT_1572137 [Mycena metata]
MVRPVADNPLTKFQDNLKLRKFQEGKEMETDTELASNSDESDWEELDDDSHADMHSEGTDSEESEDGDQNFGRNEGGVLRLRGGATKEDQMVLDALDYITPAGIERPDGSHRTKAKLHLSIHNDCTYDVTVSTKTMISKEWDSQDKSYSSYDVAWHPSNQPNASPQFLNIGLGMGIEFYGKEERSMAKLPPISHILRNQAILWVFDPELKAKVRGMVILTSTLEPLSIVDDKTVDLSATQPPSVTNQTIPSSSAAHSLALGLFEQPKDTAKSPAHRLVRRLRKYTEKAKLAISIPLHEYTARGWDATNKQWRNVIWPRLDSNFGDAGATSQAAWTLEFNQMDVDNTGLGLSENSKLKVEKAATLEEGESSHVEGTISAAK